MAEIPPFLDCVYPLGIQIYKLINTTYLAQCFKKKVVACISL